RYKCPACAAHNRKVSKEEKRTTSYHAWDPQCLEKLPDIVSSEFPFLSTRKSAVHLSVLNRLAGDLLVGKDFAATASHLYQVYIATFAAERDKYRAVAEAHRLGCSSSSSSSNCSCVQSRGEGSSSHVQISTRPEGAPAPAATTDEDHCYRTLFGAFDDPVKYSGAAPTDSYLQHVWRMWFKDLTPQSANGTPSWTLGDYERRVQHLWTASRPSTHSSQSSTSPSPMPAPPPPPLPQEAPPLPQMTDNAKARADSPSLSAPLQSLEPLAVADHQLMQAPGSHLEDSMSTVLASSSPTPPLLEVHFSSQFDANATREQQHRGLYREPFSSAKTSRLCGHEDQPHSNEVSLSSNGVLENNGTFHAAGI
ncbi:unnamed protein product, partial [Sphacelaria rigidula]